MTQKIKAAIVTGAGSGIGAAVAQRLVDDGWAVTLFGRRLDKLEETAAQIAKPDRLLVVPGDVTIPEDVEKLIAAHLEAFGRLDGLVNNAGAVVGGPIDQVKFDDWRHVMSVNLDGLFHTIGQATPHLKAFGGSIVNVSSVSGIGGDWGMSPYNASKGAVSNFTRALALDLGAQGIRGNAVAPTLTLTDMASFISESDELMDRFRTRVPLGRAAKPEEVASVIAFLLGPDASFVNGVNLPVDGGVSASNGQPSFG